MLFSGKPIIQIVTVVTCIPLFVTRAPETSIGLEELLIVLSAGGVGWEDLIRIVLAGGVGASASIIPSVPGEGTLLVI